METSSKACWASLDRGVVAIDNMERLLKNCLKLEFISINRGPINMSRQII
jgi:hypothetical protein